jgi:uncharacterized protein YecA (UPF0149 family)
VLWEEFVMARDPVQERFEKRKKRSKLADLARRVLSTEQIEAEEEAIRRASQERAKDPDKYKLKSGESVGRNDPCPCGSGKKYKKCCGTKS